MEVVVACCAGLDVHQASVVACVNRTGRDGRSHKEVRTFGTMRDDLVALRDWLKQAGCCAGRDGKHRGLLEAGV